MSSPSSTPGGEQEGTRRKDSNLIQADYKVLPTFLFAYTYFLMDNESFFFAVSPNAIVNYHLSTALQLLTL